MKQQSLTICKSQKTTPNMKVKPNQARSIIPIQLLFVQIILPQNQPLPLFRNLLKHLTIFCLMILLSTFDNAGNGGTQPRVVPDFTSPATAKKSKEKTLSLSEVAKIVNIVLNFSDKMLPTIHKENKNRPSAQKYY